MSLEISLSGSLSFTSATGITDSLATPAATNDSPAQLSITRLTQLATTTQAPINLGALNTLGWFICVNRDPTNYVTLLTSNGGVGFAKIGPGKSCGPIYAGNGVTAPAILANTANCAVDILMCAQ